MGGSARQDESDYGPEGSMLSYSNNPDAPRFPTHPDLAIAQLRANAHID